VILVIDFFAGMIISILAGMGIGGGGLLVLYLVYVKNMEQISAQGINLLFFIFAAVSSLLYHRKKRDMDYKMCLKLMAFGAMGAILGALTAQFLDGGVIRKMFGWLLITSGSISLLKKKKE